jgi:exopolysaccharide production protein ExoZ
MIWSLQVLRFIAALMVVYVHSAQVAFVSTGSIGFIPHSLAVMGRAGVDIFFVLSGVVISITARDMTPSQFAWRRLRRILPIYWVACIGPILIASKTGLDWRGVLATVLLWPATEVMREPYLPVAWTLTFEMLFYLSVVLVLIDQRWFHALLGLYALAFLLRPCGPVFQILGNPLVLEFLFGVVIAKLPMWRGAVVGIPVGLMALSITGILRIAPAGGTLEFLTGEENLQRVFVYGLPSALIVYGTIQIKVREGLWTYLGEMSYSLYLFHPLVVSLLLRLWTAFPIQPDLIVAVTVIASTAISWRVHEMVEKPVLRKLPSDWNAVRRHVGERLASSTMPR